MKWYAIAMMTLTVFMLLCIEVNGFVVPNTFVTQQQQQQQQSTSLLKGLPSIIETMSNNIAATSSSSSIVLSVDDTAEFIEKAAVEAPSAQTEAILEALPSTNSILETLSSIASAVGGLLLLFTVITFITVTYVVPQAAKQLEENTKRLRPGLWEEYEAKLKPGETMDQRPDLLQQLGNIMQPIIMAQIPTQVNQELQQQQKNDTPNSSDVVDVDVSSVQQQDDNDDNKPNTPNISISQNKWDD